MSTRIILSQGPADPFANPVLCPTDSAGTKLNGGRFGCSRDDGATWHGGTDLKAAEGTLFVAIYSGEVTLIRDLKPTDANYKSGVGNFIIVRSDGFSTKYCHLSEIKVAVGDMVSSGATLGKTGKSGNAYSAPFKHLHVEISTTHFSGLYDRVDPEQYLKTKYTKSGAVAGTGDTPKNPNLPNHSDCPAIAEQEELQKLEESSLLKEKLLDSGSWNADTSKRYRGGQGMHYKVKNVNILGTTITIDSNLDGQRSLIIPPLTTVDITFSCFGVEPLGWQFDISTNSDAFIVTWELYSTWTPSVSSERDITMQLASPLSLQDIYSKIAANNNSPFSKELIAAICWAESGFVPDAVSTDPNSTSKGLMMVNDKARKTVNDNTPSGIHFDSDDMFDPDLAIACGTWYLKILFTKPDWDCQGNKRQTITVFRHGKGSTDYVYTDKVIVCEGCLQSTVVLNPQTCLNQIHV